jgi:hypothetical protein
MYYCCFRNIGVLQTTVAEMVTVKEHQRELTDHFRGVLEPLADRSQARAYTIMPFVWCLG